MDDNETCIYFVFQSAFKMNTETKPQDTLRDIKQMMESSSRFISLSGLSGIAAGLCALVGAYFAHKILFTQSFGRSVYNADYTSVSSFLNDALFQIALITFIAALLTAFTFTYIRSKKTRTPIWGSTAKRLMFNVCLPMVVGGIFIISIIQNGCYGLVAPGCLLFYGLALVNGSKFTLGEIKYLGYVQIILGLINLYFIGYGIYFWAIGFGIMHILYGIIMWFKYERAKP